MTTETPMKIKGAVLRFDQELIEAELARVTEAVRVSGLKREGILLEGI